MRDVHAKRVKITQWKFAYAAGKPAKLRISPLAPLML